MPISPGAATWNLGGPQKDELSYAVLWWIVKQSEDGVWWLSLLSVCSLMHLSKLCVSYVT